MERSGIRDRGLGRLYEVVATADLPGLLIILDDSGAGYFCPAPFFEAVEIQENTANWPHALLAA
jgi:hypothetical protein